MLKHPELAPAWTAFVVGVHFVPLARVFAVRAYVPIGIVLAAWAVFCCIAYRGDTLGMRVSVGAAVILWATCAYALINGRQALASFKAA